MEMLSLYQGNLPDTIEDLARFVLVGREKLAAVRAEIRAIDKLKLADDVRVQKKEEAQYIAEAVMDAEVRVGELLKHVPPAGGGDRRSSNFKEGTAAPLETPKQQARESIGISTDQAKRFIKLADNKEIVEQAKAEARERDDIVSRSFVLEKIKTAEREGKELGREVERAQNAEKVSALESPLEAQGLFQTIVIDPPWDWGDEGDVNQMGRAKPDYSTMPIDEIEAFPVSKIADKNCHLYLWVTNRSLPKAFRLIEAWGFRYITCLTWVKPSFGMGNYFRGSTEQVLFAVKGSQPLRRKDVGTHFEAPRGCGHSAKPDAFYNLVQSCSYGPYIDIFGRKERDGWVVWGENGSS